MSNMTDKQRRCIQFIERMLEISYTGDDSKEAASNFISRNLENARKCQWFESQIMAMSIPGYSAHKDLYSGQDWETTEDNMDAVREMKDNLMCGMERGEALERFAEQSLLDKIERY